MPGKNEKLRTHARLMQAVSLAAVTWAVSALPLTAIAQQMATIRVGSNMNGTLQRGDSTLSGGEFVDRITFQGTANQRVRIEMSSSQIDSYLLLQGPNGFTEENDDVSSGNLNSVLEVTLPATGTYTIGATSARAAETGSYRLAVTGSGGSQAAQPQNNSRPTSNTSSASTLRPGQTVNGSLAQGDTTLGTGEFVDVLTFQGNAGQQVTFNMSSTQLDSYLLLTGPDGFSEQNDDVASGNLNASITVRLPATGTYTIGATSNRPGETGSYQLSMSNGGSQASRQQSNNQQTSNPPPVGGAALRIGQTINGSLAQGDGQLPSGEFRDTYSVPVNAGDRLEIRMNSSALDSYLLVRGPGDLSEDNDDDQGSSGTRNSRLVVTAQQAGTMVVSATSFEAGETGAYQLSVQRVAGGAQAARPNQPGPQNRPASGPQQLAAGRAINASLASGDQQLNSGEFYDDFTINARAGQQITVDMVSSAFDSYLMVAGPDNFTQQNDDGPNGTNAQLVFTAPTAGTYMVRATSFRAGESGAYSINLGGGAGAQANRPSPPPPGPISRQPRIALGETQTGTLGQGDSVRQGGAFVDTFVVQGRPGERAAITLSGDFDTILSVISPSGTREQNDDARSGTTDSYLEVEFSENGTYQIEATSYQPNTSGRYQLVMQPVRSGQTRSVSLSPPQISGPQPPAPTGTQIGIGQSRSGSLAQGDSQLSSGEFIDNYTFTGQRGDNVRIDLESANFDTYLLVTPPTGDQLDNDDGPNGTNSQVDFTLPAAGTYRIGVTSFQPGETGAYNLRVSRSTAAVANSGGGDASAGKVYGVFIGISDYPGNGDLDNTDKDARDLANSLRRGGILAPESVILTDGQATNAAVTEAIRRVAALAGPNDTFLVFFSGHGNQVTNTPGARSEPDGRDETIALYDTQMSDDTMAQLYAGSRAGTSMLILDSCFSGGFARDVVSRPGVMGLFSSEEDLTSQVASKFEAGGYLSHFVRLAFEGEADANSNRSITAGELSTYLRRKFADEGTISASTLESQRNYQYLVVERGGVKIDDVVMVLR
jgi:hypothetical protein